MSTGENVKKGKGERGKRLKGKRGKNSRKLPGLSSKNETVESIVRNSINLYSWNWDFAAYSVWFSNPYSNILDNLSLYYNGGRGRAGV